MQATRGFTAVELLVALGIIALLLAAGTPLVRWLLLDARMTGAVNSLVHVIHFARQEAHRDLRDVVVCRSVTGASCAAPGDWSVGWIAFINRDGDDPPIVDAGEPVLHVTQRQALRSIASNRRAYIMRPFPLRATNGTVIFCDERGPSRARAVIVSYTGRPRVSGRAAGGQPLACPA
jgi:type IV fimbrial biogenesis protein FimT